MRNYILFISYLFFMHIASAQELQCGVTINSDKASSTDPKVFKTLESSIKEFMNNRKWTDDNFKTNEKIDCEILITITDEFASDRFGADISIVSRRPVFNSDYNSTLLNYVDKNFDFKYTEYQSLDFNENTFLSNITGVLSYYAYIIIGLDYDSFSEKGGTPYFLKAQSIVNQAQNRDEPGWKSYENPPNRYWLINNLMDAKFSPFRDAFYQYHRLGLDMMYEDQVKPLNTITHCLQLLDNINRTQPNSMIMQLFFNAKSDELQGLYSKSIPSEKAKAVNLLIRLDPVNGDQYQNILKSK